MIYKLVEWLMIKRFLFMKNFLTNKIVSKEIVKFLDKPSFFADWLCIYP